MSHWSARDLKLRQWVMNNPGACKEIAVENNVSAEYVRLVLYGKRGGTGKGTTPVMAGIIKQLKSKGAPI